jgi:pyrroloquinoline quinone biosynthesis protein D
VTPLPPGTRPRLSRKVRLKYDAIEKQFLVLYPERGITLSESAAEILQRCDGERTAEMIAAELAQVSGAAIVVVRKDVEAFLGEMKKRGIVELV